MDIPNLKPTKNNENVFVIAFAIGVSFLLLVFSESKNESPLKSLSKTKQEFNFARGK